MRSPAGPGGGAASGERRRSSGVNTADAFFEAFFEQAFFPAPTTPTRRMGERGHTAHGTGACAAGTGDKLSVWGEPRRRVCVAIDRGGD
eukprot:2609820-Prymnesium_polylepis.1